MDLNKVERVYTSYAGIYDKLFGKVFHEGRESAIRNSVHPSLVCTTTSTRRFGLCSSIDPFGDARNFAEP